MFVSQLDHQTTKLCHQSCLQICISLEMVSVTSRGQNVVFHAQSVPQLKALALPADSALINFSELLHKQCYVSHVVVFLKLNTSFIFFSSWKTKKGSSSQYKWLLFLKLCLGRVNNIFPLINTNLVSWPPGHWTLIFKIMSGLNIFYYKPTVVLLIPRCLIINNLKPPLLYNKELFLSDSAVSLQTNVNCLMFLLFWLFKNEWRGILNCVWRVKCFSRNFVSIISNLKFNFKFHSFKMHFLLCDWVLNLTILVFVWFVFIAVAPSPFFQQMLSSNYFWQENKILCDQEAKWHRCRPNLKTFNDSKYYFTNSRLIKKSFCFSTVHGYAYLLIC